MATLEEYEDLIIDWADERGILEHSTPAAQMLKCVSEMGELADAVAKGEDIRDHVGDTIVTLILLTHLTDLDLNLQECLAFAWDEIKDRKGTMVPGGVFIKETPQIEVQPHCSVGGTPYIGHICKYGQVDTEVCNKPPEYVCRHAVVEETA